MADSIILFGGTFNPIHVAHVTIASRARSFVAAKEVLFMPTRQNPLKDSLAIPLHHRVTMLKIATEHLPWAKVVLTTKQDDTATPDYTITTVENLYKERNFTEPPYLLIGEDLIATLPNWHRLDDLLQMVRLLIVSRSDQACIACSYPHTALVIPHLDIASTTIRLNIDSAYQEQHLHPKVWEYIKRERLYC
ncbi:nicotinate (nicotinamide) nucleotide adenylyltransferase [Entomospira entomophila]|uniref:Probable nicotinate-nucleotide adenylyltransferase n=1 Tax=Entomospira entomophila TaxID=2719988 RepID=A0A968KWU0_9SPIO|nr:nicotinate (nicotinamide) nucleotide adenylyltransferase [Entomospira entomophilus]NIZ41160.1 nicotinate (nicotinamide) nucleotide adenylyltransferase [Entomospira entomophilus]WDI35367.1 nicotinate (nicotinamide) nucleotide adenylyltransferase [Entomospira entomophilus]